MQLTVLASLAKCSHFALLLFQAIACAGEDRIFFNRYILENGNLKAQIGELVEAQSIPVGVPKICLKRDAERRCSLANETMFLCVAAQWSKETRTRLTPLPLDVDEKKEGKKKKTKKKKKKSKKKVSDDMGDEFYNSDSKIAAPFVHVGKAPEPAELLAKMQLDVPAVETSEQASKEEDRPTLNRKNTKGTMVAEPEPMPSFLAHGKPKSEPGNCASSCDKNTCGGVSPDLYVDDGFGGKIKKKDKKRRTKPENDVSVEDYAKQIGWEKVPRDSSTEEGLARVTEVLESAKQKLKCPEPGPLKYNVV